MSDSDGLGTKIIDAFLGDLASTLLAKVRNYTSNTEIAIKLRDKIKNNSEEICNSELLKFLNTVLIRSFEKLSMTEPQRDDIKKCQDFKNTIIELVLNATGDIIVIAELVNYGTWEFHQDGYNVRTLLVTIAEEIKRLLPEFLSFGELLLIGHIANTSKLNVRQTVAELRGDDRELEAVKILVKEGKIKQALIRANTLNANHLSNQKPDIFRLSVLKQISVCQGRLPYSIPREEHIQTLYEMLLHTIEEDGKERIRAVISHLNNNNILGLQHSRKAIALNPQNPIGYVYNCKLELLVNGIDAGRKVISTVPESIIQSEYLQFAGCYALVQDYQNAEECSYKYLEDNDGDIDSLIIIAEIQLMRIQENLQATNTYKILDSALLKELKQRIGKIRKVLNDEDEENLFKCLHMEGRLKLWEQDFTQAEISLRKAHELNPSNQENLQLLIRAFRETGNNIEIVEFANKLDSEDLFFRLWKNYILVEQGHPDIVLLDVRQILLMKNLNHDDILQIREIEVSALIRLGRIKEAKLIEKEIQDEFPDLPYAYKIRADFLLKFGDYEGAIKCLRIAMGMDSTSIGYSIIPRMLFELLSQSNKFDDIQEAISLGELLFDTLQFDPGIIIYLRLLCSQNKFMKCIQICQEIEPHRSKIKEWKEIESIALYNVKEYEASALICKWLYSIDFSNIKAVELWCWNLFSLRLFTEIKELIEIAEPRLSTNILFLQLCSEVFKKIYLTVFDEESINTSLSYAQRAIELSNEDQDCVDWYLNIHFPLINQFVFEEHRLFAQKIVQTYKHKHKDSKTLQEFTFPSDPDEIKTFLIENFSFDKSYYEKIVDTYNLNKFPISFLSVALRKDNFISWQIITSQDSKLKVWLCDFFGDEYILEDKILEKQVDVLISLHSFFLIHKLNLLNNLPRVFKSISVSRSGWEELQVIRESMVNNANEGSRSLFISQNEVIMTETLPEFHKQELNHIDEILCFINNKCQIVGQYTMMFDKSENENSKIQGALGMESSELILSKNLKYVVYSDDHCIRNTSKIFTGKESTYILPYLRKLLKLSLIDFKEYCRCTVLLIKLNYYRIAIEQNVIRHIIYDSKYVLTDDVKLCLLTLYDNTLDAQSLVYFLFDLLRWVWVQPMIKDSKIEFTRYVIDIIAKRTTLDTAINLIESNINKIIIPSEEEAKQDLSCFLKSFKV
ncbi:MAG: hypothetical protein U0264_01745 [Candidatus Kapaibacterium sp.]